MNSDVVVVAMIISYLFLLVLFLILFNRKTKSEHKYKELLGRYQIVVESVKEVIFIMDKAKCWLFINQGWIELTGYSSNQSIGRNYIDYVHPDDHETIEKHLL
ncbi:PAS domain-containing protein [Anaerobacillus sp. CMMVII]|nr:PAS domain-containing protein [Anaerobacillus sp. CMMVII]